MDTVREAREKCPEIILVHVATFTGTEPPAYHKSPSASTHKVSLDEYRRASRKIMDLFKRICPVMSKASIDEAYLDASDILQQQILDDFGRGMLELTTHDHGSASIDQMLPSPLACDSDTDATPLVPVVRWVPVSRKGKEKETAIMNESTSSKFGVLVGDPPPVSFGWNDLLLRYAAKFAQHIRSTLFQELGYQASAGIAHNRYLAKICSALNKPDQQTVLLLSQTEPFLRTYPLTSIPALGGKLGALVENAFGAATAGDLMDYTIDQLILKLGPEQAHFVYNRCHGIDDSPVVDNKEPGTLTSVKNFLRYPVESLAKLERWIAMNSMDLWTRVIEEWEMRKRWPRSLTVSYTTRGHSQRSRTTAFPPRTVKGSHNSPDAVVAAVNECLSSEMRNGATSKGQPPGFSVHSNDIFPMTGFMLTAKSFQRELASASMMERWLSRPRNSQTISEPLADGPGGMAQRPKQQIMDDTEDFARVSGDKVHVRSESIDEMTSRMNSIDSTGIQNIDREQLPVLPKQNLTSMLKLNSQPTTVVESRRPASFPPIVPQIPAALHQFSASTVFNSENRMQASSTNSPASSSSSSAQTPPHMAYSSQFSSADMSFRSSTSTAGALSREYYSNVPPPHSSNSSLSPPPLILDGTIQPDLVEGSEFETSDSDQSILKTPPEPDSEEYDETDDEATGTDPEAAAGSDSDAEARIRDDAMLAHCSDDFRTAASNRANTSSGRKSEGIDGDRRPLSRGNSGAVRMRNSVYIQTVADLESAARYGEGYKNVNIDRHDDGSLEVAASGDTNGDMFIPALIAATRRKREIQIVRFQNSVDTPEGAISGDRDASIQEKRAPGSRRGGNSSSASKNDKDKTKARGKLKSTAAEDDEYDSSTDDEISSVLNQAVSAMMESISTSQAVMQIHCPQCPENAPPITSRDWETHRDWHIAKHLQERELRHESAARHFQRAFNDSEPSKPATKRAKREEESGKRRQQTITESWK
ncbi:N-acetyltransferase eso1 [Coemansia brasiliensis]|uniref:N-acetyltransferase eso1 n=1 Tax=Coemansia brasiliensis TaxID=2650707 RepID=A0A9W8IFD1_9FUNG|nr:N-acetyltransferase eso1 [Coemansia brasiliensis]